VCKSKYIFFIVFCLYPVTRMYSKTKQKRKISVLQTMRIGQNMFTIFLIIFFYWYRSIII